MTKLSRVLLLATAAAAVTACGDDDGSSGMGQIRVIHASPDAPPVNIYVDRIGPTAKTDVADIAGLDYGQSSGYAGFPEGTYDISIRGILPGGELEVIPVSGFSLDAGAMATFVAINDVSAISGAVVPDSAATPGSGEVALAVFHGATVAGSVDVYVTSPGADIASLPPAFTFDFGQTVDVGAVPVGNYEIQIALAGADTPVYNSGSVDLGPFGGQKLLITALDAVNDTASAASPVQLLVATDDAALGLLDADTAAGIRVVHLSPDAALAAGGPVEVFATSDALGGTVELIDSFSYLDTVPGADAHVAVPAGQYTIDVAPDTDSIGDSVFTSAPLSFAAGQEYTAIAAGRVASSPAFGLLALEDESRAIATQASVRVAHAAPAAGDVNVYVTPAGQFSVADVEAGLAGAPLLSAFPFGAVTDYVALSPGQYDIRVVPLSLGVVAINVEGLNLAPGLVATVAARGPGEADGDPADFGVLLLTN